MNGAPQKTETGHTGGFSLVEVTLALGVFALALVTLLGLLTPALEQARSARQQHAAVEVIAVVGEALRSGQFEDSLPNSAFDAVYRMVASEPGLLFVFSTRDDETPGVQVTRDPSRVLEVDRFLFAARVSAAGLNPPDYLVPLGETYALNTSNPRDYPEGYLALRVDLYELPVPPPGTVFVPPPLVPERFLFSFHTAVVR